MKPETRGLLKGLALGVIVSTAVLWKVGPEKEPPVAGVDTPTAPSQKTPLSKEDLSEFLDDYTHSASPHGATTDPGEGELPALLEAGDWMNAFQLAEERLQADPNDVDALVALVEVRIKMGQPTRASALVERALALAPTHVKALALREQIAVAAFHP